MGVGLTYVNRRLASLLETGAEASQVFSITTRVFDVNDPRRDRTAVRATLGKGLAVSAFPLYVPV